MMLGSAVFLNPVDLLGGKNDLDLGGGSPNSHTFVDYKFPTASDLGIQERWAF